MKERRSLAMLMTFLLMLSVWCMGTVSASAAKAKAPECVKQQTIKLLKVAEGESTDAEYDGGYICIKNLSTTAKITDIKSSNKNVKVESMVEKYGFNAIHVYPKNAKVKNGTKSNITIKIRQNNKSYTLKCTVTFKYESPFKTLKIGNKDYANVIRKQKQSAQTVNKKGLNIKAAPGYRITGVYIASFPVFDVDEDGYPCAMSFARKYVGNEINLLKNYDFGGIRTVVVYYKVMKPANYTKPKRWNGELDSPLYGFKEINFEK